MSRLSRSIPVVTMLVLYGSVSFCGTGLHMLIDPGCLHASDRQRLGPTVKAASGHCPLCEFQAQGQMVIESAAVESRPHTSPNVALIPTLVATHDIHPSCSPRAPPAALACIL